MAEQQYRREKREKSMIKVKVDFTQINVKIKLQ